MRFRHIVVLLVLFRIGLLAYFVLTEGKYLYPDSPMYLALAENLIKHHVFSLSATEPFIPHVFRTPGYPVFLAIFNFLGVENPYLIVLVQEIIYAATIVGFYFLSRGLFDRNMIRGGLIFLLLEPGGLTYPKLLLSEILFFPALVFGVLLIGQYLRRNRLWYLIIAGFIMGLGALVRPGMIYLPVILAMILIAFNFRQKKTWLHAITLVIIFGIVITPWLVRNHYHFNKFMLSGIQGYTLANYHVPMVWELFKGLPQAESQNIIQGKVDTEKQQLEKTLGRPASAADVFHLQQKVAVKELLKMPGAYSVAWLYGMLKTMNGPNIIELYDILSINPDRPRLFQIISEQGWTGVFYYLVKTDLLFLLNSILTILMTGLALLGAISILKSKDAFLWVMMLSNFYFIASAGPMGEARFRFPVGLFWFIQAYLGWRFLVAVLQHWRHGFFLKAEAVK